MIRRYKNKQDRRVARIRAKIKNTGRWPRLTVFRSNKSLYAQIIDDQKRITLLAVSSRSIKAEDGSSQIEKAKKLGKFLAETAVKKKIKKIVFDRGAYQYHGQIAALAEGAREGGLEF